MNLTEYFASTLYLIKNAFCKTCLTAVTSMTDSRLNNSMFICDILYFSLQLYFLVIY